jgi:hypothetical protein
MKKNYTEINACRICGNTNLITVFDLGVQYLTGVFPKNENIITSGPVTLIKCHGDDFCGLLQLKQSYNLDEMYGENYGYRSGLNLSMVNHLKNKVEKIFNYNNLKSGDLVIDIGSNDGTTLGFYPDNLLLIGIDPTGEKFKNYYKENITLLPNYFSSNLILDKYPNKKAKVITSFSMFYDLEDPIKFASEICAILDPIEGVWIFEQSYMPSMLEKNSYDTICHEHLEFYSLKQIHYITEKAGLKIIDVEFNDINGGSFSVTASVKSSRYIPNSSHIHDIFNKEILMNLNSLIPYEKFKSNSEKNKSDLINFVLKVKKDNKNIFGIGASTKGNVLLQYCNFTIEDLPYIGDVNPDKFNSFTPGSMIPIIDEDIILKMNPDYLIILPWHFKNFFITNPKFKGISLIFPFPNLEIINL